MLSLYLGVPFLAVVLMELATLYDVIPGVKFRQLVLKEFVIFLIIVITLVIWVSNWWKKWALSVVKPTHKERLKSKIEGKDSLVIKTWDKLDIYKKILRVSLIIALFIGAIIGDNYWKRKQRLLESDTSYSEAHITDVKRLARNKRGLIMAYYTYQLDGESFNDSTVISSGWVFSLEDKNGFNIISGDRFALRYYTPDHTIIKRVAFHKPLGDTEIRYLTLTKEVCYNLYPNTDIDCLVDSIYAHFGTDGIGILYNHKTGYWANENYNHIRFKTMARKEDFKKLKKACAK